MRILVTGATSLIGRHTVARLVERGDQVTTIQRSASGLPTREVRGSITDRAVLDRACEGQEAVIHLAAKVGVTGRWEEFESVNLGGTVALLGSARRAGVTRIVHVSSPSVAHSGDPLVGAGAGPADPHRTRGHYATSKAYAEQAAIESSSSDLAVVAIRPHLVWGPGDTQLVGRIVERARQGRLALVGSGAAMIDTTYVTNAADALIAAVDQAPRVAGTAWVVSNGEPRPVAELVSRIVTAAGVPWRSRRVPTGVAIGVGAILERVWERGRRAGDPPMTRFLAEQLSTAHWFDQRATQAALGWEPTVSLAEGFDHLTEWYRSGVVGGSR